MFEIGIGLLTILLLIGFVIYKQNKRELMGIILDAKPIEDYFFEAKIKLRNGKIVKKFLLSKVELRRNLKVLIQPLGENLWKVKPL